jgi:small subunit ribosomal protein S25e
LQAIIEMGGTKKKGLAAMEKQQDSTDGASAGQAGQQATKGGKKGKETKSGPSQQKRLPFLLPKMSEEDMVRSLTSLRAITVHGASKALGVNASIATLMLNSLEGKSMIRRVGGFSGHYVWATTQRIQPKESASK